MSNINQTASNQGLYMPKNKKNDTMINLIFNWFEY